MGLIKGGFQRILATVFYALLFICTAIILGIYSYFLSILADRSIPIPTWQKYVEGISGVATAYLIAASLLTLCLGGHTIVAIVQIVLDIIFFVCMLAITILTRDGADSCKGRVETPIGNGPAESHPGFGSNGLGGDGGENYTYKVQLGLACRLNTVAFAISLIAALLFLCAAGLQVMLRRHHQKEKAADLKPAKTSGSSSWKSKLPFGRKKGDGLVHDVKDPNGTRDY